MPASRVERLTEAASNIRVSGEYRWVGLYEVGAAEVRMVAYSGPAPPAFPVFSRHQGLTGEAIRLRAPVISNDVLTDPRYLTALGSTRSEMIVPILSSSTRDVIGTIDVESDRVDAFSHAEAEALRLTAASLEHLFS